MKGYEWKIKGLSPKLDESQEELAREIIWKSIVPWYDIEYYKWKLVNIVEKEFPKWKEITKSIFEKIDKIPICCSFDELGSVVEKILKEK